MLNPALEAVFINAAWPQKIILVVLVAAMPTALLAGSIAMAGGRNASLWRRFVSDIRWGAPLIALLVGGLNSFHMAGTITRLPFDPTLKQLAPGIYEVSTFVSIGAVAGLIATVTVIVLDLVRSASQTR